ncbi:hypothetical protein B566_EDAN007787 [Ephemera danica]|nr:hypothetical protein B566_EDAN007787 [Ephemera danica]
MINGRLYFQCQRLSIVNSCLFRNNHKPKKLYSTSGCVVLASRACWGLQTKPDPTVFKNWSCQVREFRVSGATMAHSSSTKKANRLGLEKSPYLLQHAYNPVEWYPWGEEAFERARKEDKLIFLSVGYSTCHWCHVMERESFENDGIAQIMNEHFINVKVDREERPDVDRVYMTFVQASSGRGGWPMSVFLTPTLIPVAGGTYFPPRDTFGRPGFPTVLLSLATQWKENQQKFFDSGAKIMEVLQRNSKLESTSESSSTEMPGSDCWRTCLSQLSRSFEPEFGGFGSAPKFPQPSNFNFLFHVYARDPNSEAGKKALEMSLYTLKMMAKGGMHDHVSQGFARYSTDDRWHVPHFEKMLYDQGQLLVSYAAAYTATKDEFFAEIVRDIVTYVSRDLSHPLGGFYSAEDADSLPSFDSTEKKEGAFCVWTYEEVDALLGNLRAAEDSPITLAELAAYHYDIKPNGNVNPYQDPHDELKNQNVLIVTGSEEQTSEKFSLSLEATRLALKKSREILHEARQNRPRPHLDDKMVTAWNGLMISGLSKAYEAVGETHILERAIKAADFVRKYLYVEESGMLLRSCYQGPDKSVTQIASPVSGFADDYAFLVRGLLDLYEASSEDRFLVWAEQLQDKQDELFWDHESTGYFTAAKDPTILLRLKEDQDGAEPACASVAAANLLRLAVYLERNELEQRAARLLTAYSSRLAKIPVALPEMSSALMLYHDSPTQVFLAGDLKAESTQTLLAAVRGRLVTGRVLGFVNGQEDGILFRRNEVVKQMHACKDGTAMAYVCRNHTCSLPVQTVYKLLVLLDLPAK